MENGDPGELYRFTHSGARPLEFTLSLSKCAFFILFFTNISFSQSNAVSFTQEDRDRIIRTETKLDEKFKVEKRDTVSRFPWTLNSAPIMIRAKARQIPGWHLYNEMAGPLPFTFIYNQDVSPKTEDIILVPYGCTELRISEFPVVNDK